MISARVSLGLGRAGYRLPSIRVSSCSTSKETPEFIDRVTRKRESHTTWKFVDRVQLEVKGGRGGNGCVSFEVLSPGRKRPSGGSGGKGGNVYIVADRSLTGLKFQTFHFNARDGAHGGSSGLTGRRGEDVIVQVPLGTIVSERLHNFYTRPAIAIDDFNWDQDDDDDEEEEEEEEEEEDGNKLVVEELKDDKEHDTDVGEDTSDAPESHKSILVSELLVHPA